MLAWPFNGERLLEKIGVILLGFMIITLLLPSLAKAKGTEEFAGDIGQLLIPATAYGLTFLEHDQEGRNQFYKSYAATLATTYSLKYLVDKTRPNGGDYSFPSGHTASAFSGAAFLQRRYGLKYGIPAYLAASFVGVSRVDCQAHDYVDVTAGAAIGILSNLYFTTRFKDVTVTPMVDENTIGATLSFKW